MCCFGGMASVLWLHGLADWGFAHTWAHGEADLNKIEFSVVWGLDQWVDTVNTGCFILHWELEVRFEVSVNSNKPDHISIKGLADKCLIKLELYFCVMLNTLIDTHESYVLDRHCASLSFIQHTIWLICHHDLVMIKFSHKDHSVFIWSYRCREHWHTFPVFIASMIFIAIYSQSLFPSLFAATVKQCDLSVQTDLSVSTGNCVPPPYLKICLQRHIKYEQI